MTCVTERSLELWRRHCKRKITNRGKEESERGHGNTGKAGIFLCLVAGDVLLYLHDKCCTAVNITLLWYLRTKVAVSPKVRRSHQRTFDNGPWPWFLLSDDMLKLSISVESQNRIGVSDNTCARAVKMEVNLKLDLAGFGRSLLVLHNFVTLSLELPHLKE